MTWGATGPSRAVDGIITGNLNGQANAPANSSFNMCTHTEQISNPWSGVDVGLGAAFDRVKIFPRTDCCAGRNAGLQVRVSNVNVWTSSSQADRATRSG